jgi:hypothetical protein
VYNDYDTGILLIRVPLYKKHRKTTLDAADLSPRSNPSAILLSVIARATTLWGGLFNPIVILDDASRKTVGVHYPVLPPDPYFKIQSDMLKAFDPDLLINYSSDPLPSELKVWEHRTFPADRLDWRPTKAMYARTSSHPRRSLG